MQQLKIILHAEVGILGCYESVCFAALQISIPVPDDVQTTFNVTVGNTAILPCPIKPGALLQYYSVWWNKDNTLISELQLGNLQTTTIDSRYKISETTFSLIIDSVNVNDSSKGYKCEVSVNNPLTDAVTNLQLSYDVLLSLDVIDNVSSTPESTMSNTPESTMSNTPESTMPDSNSKLLSIIMLFFHEIPFDGSS